MAKEEKGKKKEREGKKKERKNRDYQIQNEKNVELTLGVVSMRVDECLRARVRVCVRERVYVETYMRACRWVFFTGVTQLGETAREKRKRG